MERINFKHGEGIKIEFANENTNPNAYPEKFVIFRFEIKCKICGNLTHYNCLENGSWSIQDFFCKNCNERNFEIIQRK